MPAKPAVLCVGHAVHDFVFGVAAMPAAAKKHRATAFESVGGGPAATAAVAVARLGGAAALAARVGDDAVGGLIVAELEGYGVDCALVRRCAGRRSSVSAVMIDPAGERMIVNYLDPDLPQDAGWLPDPLSAGAAAVLADVRWAEGAKTILPRARAAGIPAVLDADHPLPADPALLAGASHIAFSADGLADYARGRGTADALRAAAAETGAWACVTLGADGVMVADGDGMATVPGFRVAAVDTLGAGDVWHGAFALALAERRPEAAAVRFANAAAALKVGRAGGRRGAPTRAEVDRFLSEHAA
jgi:sulfofructose kinase